MNSLLFIPSSLPVNAITNVKSLHSFLERLKHHHQLFIERYHQPKDLRDVGRHGCCDNAFADNIAGADNVEYWIPSKCLSIHSRTLLVVSKYNFTSYHSYTCYLPSHNLFLGIMSYF
jgi:hypothetical protein